MHGSGLVVSESVKTKRNRTRRRKKPSQTKSRQDGIDGKVEKSSENRKNDAGSIVETLFLLK